MRLHRMTEDLLRGEPEFARLLLESDRLAIRSTNVLSGMSRRIALFTLFASTRHILTFLEGLPAEENEIEKLANSERAERRERLQRDVKSTIDTHERILANFVTNYYDEAAARQAQIVYLGGMLKGFVVLIAGAIGLGYLFTSLDVPGVDMTTFLGCLIAGGIGAVVSVLMRMNAGKFSVNHEVGREYLSRLGSFRPAIGAVFALLTYFTLRGGLLPNVDPPSTDGDSAQAFSWYLAVGFLMGFSERLAKEMVSKAEGSVGISGTEMAASLPAAPSPSPSTGSNEPRGGGESSNEPRGGGESVS
jgi:hypothetical protein